MMRFCLLALLLVAPLVSWAQAEEFTIRVFGSSDTIPPSTPVIASVVPITTNQIDLRWSTSTDNFLVFGYVVLRDGVAIATTTLTSFSDTSLIASTTYSYQILAFDTVPNYSALSLAIATTTQSIPVVASPIFSGSQSATIARVVLESVQVAADAVSATIDVQVRRPARIELRLGETTSYEIGYFVGNVYRTGHSIPLNDLRANTRYYYELVGYTPNGIQTVLERGSFTTVNITPPTAPANVSGFTTSVSTAGVSLTWQAPIVFPIDGSIRVVRSHLGFPQSINDGFVVYEGVGNTTLDRDAFVIHDTAYYTVFVIDPTGLISSGAVALSRQTTSVRLPGDLPAAPVGNNGQLPPDQSVVATTSLEQLPDDSRMPGAIDLLLFQSGVITSFASSSVQLSSVDVFTVSVPAEKITGPFKTIIATLSDPLAADTYFSFLLRLNPEKTAYTATIAPIKIAGFSSLEVAIFDFETKVVGKYQIEVEFLAGDIVPTPTVSTQFVWQLKTWLWSGLLLVPLITLMVLWFVFKDRDEEDEDNDKTK